jgi:hypothetical protein
MSVKLARFILILGLFVISTIQNFSCIPESLSTIITIIFIIACICEIVRERKINKKQNDNK